MEKSLKGVLLIIDNTKKHQYLNAKWREIV